MIKRKKEKGQIDVTTERQRVKATKRQREKETKEIE